MFSNLYESIINTLIMLMLISTSQTLCPSMCSCIWRNGKQTSICEKQGLIAIPTGLSPSTQVLILSGNNLQILPSRVFQERGLINLQKLFLSECKLGEIATDSFVQLTNLVELDLNTNFLTFIPSESFKECIFLRKLTLNSNPYHQIKSESFLNLKNLVFLDLSKCKIDRIESHAFKGLNKLQFLKLDSNRLQTIAPNVISDLTALYSVDLHQNEWNCDCSLRSTIEWIIRNKVSQSVYAKCQTPQRLAGISWHLLEIDEFSCSPLIHTKSTQFFKQIGSNITISCSVSGLPLPSVNWYFDYHIRTNLSSSDFQDERYSVEEKRNDTILTTIITIFDLKSEDSQHFICSAENSAGIVKENFTLTVLTLSKSSQSVIWAQIEMYSTIIGLVFAFLLITLMMTVIVIRFKSSSSVHISLVPKLAQINVLQDVEISEFKIKNKYFSKPSIAFISNIINNNEIINQSKAHRYSPSLQTPDVTNSVSQHYSADGTSNPSDISLNLVNNYQDVYGENLLKILKKSDNTHRSYCHYIYDINTNSISDTQNSSNKLSYDQQIYQISNPKIELNANNVLVEHSFKPHSNDLNNI